MWDSMPTPGRLKSLDIAWKDDETWMVDYYEFLQISPNADADTIHRVYRFLAARLHPDNKTTGDAEQFKLLKTAYDVLSDREQRAEYDTLRRLSSPEPFSSMVDFMDSLEGELNRRLAVLAVLYHRRRSNAHMAEVSLAEIENRMGFPRDYLDFTLWYLKNKGYIAKADNAQFTLTAEGVDFVEKERNDLPSLKKMLARGSELKTQETGRPSEEAAAAPAPEVTADKSQPLRPEPVVMTPSMDPEYDQRLTYEQRTGRPDRRVGKPDLRKFKIERRFNMKDRRVDPNGKAIAN